MPCCGSTFCVGALKRAKSQVMFCQGYVAMNVLECAQVDVYVAVRAQLCFLNCQFLVLTVVLLLAHEYSLCQKAWGTSSVLGLGPVQVSGFLAHT